ncbi:MAG TPA: glycosyltransferase family 2 protein [Stellaceae bacterium]|jgi:glycosyltransferase involved in cell wall biosynthesis|nr:glycosyltransferase family 2 protein [Stellaceae bacterium]
MASDGSGPRTHQGAPSLSAVVVARNEEAQLAACLERLRFADDLVVVLDRSTDRSAEIARSFGARVVEGGWELEGPRRNAGLDRCRSDWIIEIDADERVPAALAQEIRRAIAQGASDIFLVPMANHIGTHRVRYGWGAYNGVAAKPILFRRGAKRWGAGRVHPRIDMTGRRGTLGATLDHYVDRDIGDMFRRLNRYTDLAALDAIDSGDIPPMGHSVRRVFSRFWKSYVARKGHREGAYGLALATFSALYPLLIYLKVATAKGEGEKK